MLPFGHAAGGYITGTLIGTAHGDSSKDTIILQVLGITGGLLPDLDLGVYQILRTFLRLRLDSQHHTWLTHTFPFYLVPGSLLIVWANHTKRTRLARYFIVLTASTGLHLAQDMFGSGDGIQLLFPFSKRMYGVCLLGVHGREWRARYVRTPIFFVEIVLVLLALTIAIFRSWHSISNCLQVFIRIKSILIKIDINNTFPSI